MADLGLTVGLIKALAPAPSDEQVESAVSDWLDDHPEATTTVEDGSITKAKLDSSLQGTVDDVGELKTEISEMNTSTSANIGKALSPKTVSNGKVTEWQFKTIEGGGSGGSDFVTPEDYGAVGDGTTDDTDAVAAAIAAGANVKFKKTYKISTITATDSVNLVGEPGAKIITPQHTSGIHFAPAKKTQITMTEDYVHDDRSEDAYGTRLAVNSTTGISVGDLVYIYATNQPYSYARQYYYKGCAALITGVDSYNSAIDIGFSMPFDLEADGTIIDVYAPITVNIENIDFESTLNLEATTQAYGVWIQYGANCKVSDCTFSGFTAGLRVTGCVSTDISNLQISNAKPNNSLGWDGYGISVESSNGTFIKAVTAHCGQHAITTGGNLPIYNTVIDGCNLYSECQSFAIGCHENNYSLVVENSVLGGMTLVGNCVVQNCRVTEADEIASKVLLDGNEGDGKSNIIFENVIFDESLPIEVNAYPQDAVRAYSVDFDGIAFRDCTGGNFQIYDMSSKVLVSGCNIARIEVRRWRDCTGFTLNYGVVSELKVESLLFKLNVAEGYITSQTKIAINSPCVVLNEYNYDEIISNNAEIGVKANSVMKNTLWHDSVALNDSASGSVKHLRIYGAANSDNPGTPFSAPKLTFLSGNVFDELNDLSIHIEGTHLNGRNAKYLKQKVIPITWKRKTMRLSCQIDATYAVVSAINSVRVYLLNSEGDEIYVSYLNGLYENTVYTSTVTFVIPDEAYYMIVTARLFADGENKEVTANDFSLSFINEYSPSITGIGTLDTIPVSSGETYTDGSGQKQLSNYMDFDNGLFVREIAWFRCSLITSDMITSMLDYFDSSIVGGFIPKSIVNSSSGIGRDLNAYCAYGRTVLETAEPPTDQASIWIDDGGIGFAFAVSDVGERSMSALAEYIKNLPDADSWLMCKLYTTQYFNLRQTDIMLYNALETFDNKSTITASTGAYVSFDYNIDLKKYVAVGEDYRLINEITLTEDIGRVYINTDSDGNSFLLSDVVIHFNLTACSASGSAIIAVNTTDTKPSSAVLNDIPQLAVESLLSTAAQGFRTARLHVDGGRFFGDSEYSNYPNYYSAKYLQSSKNASGVYACDRISSINIFSANSYTFGSGSKITIYGR